MDLSCGNAPGEAGEGPIVQHETYYFSFVVFLVENCLFKLPRYYFEQSEAFQGMFALPPTHIQEGSSAENPIRLEGMRSCDFVAFLKVLIPLEKGGVMEFEALELQEWLAALELAHKWGFKHTRQLAIEAIRERPMSEVERISLVQKYGISEWAGPAYEKLLTRDQPLTIEEGRLLGLEFSCTMAAARERLGKVLQNVSQWYCNTCKRYVQPHHLCPYCRQSDRSSITTVIREMFGDPVKIL